MPGLDKCELKAAEGMARASSISLEAMVTSRTRTQRPVMMTWGKNPMQSRRIPSNPGASGILLRIPSTAPSTPTLRKVCPINLVIPLLSEPTPVPTEPKPNASSSERVGSDLLARYTIPIVMCTSIQLSANMRRTNICAAGGRVICMSKSREGNGA